MKSNLFPELINCRDETRAITNELTHALIHLDSLGKASENLVINNDFLSAENKQQKVEIKLRESELKRSKTEIWIYRALIVGLAIFVVK